MLIVPVRVQAKARVDLDCAQGNSEGLETCQILESGDASASCSLIQPSQQLKAIEAIVNENSKIADCKKEDLGLKAEKTDEEIRQYKKELKEQCRIKAKEYKRAVLKDLAGRWKFGQALKVLFKKKRYSVSDRDEEAKGEALSFDGKELMGKSNEELNKMVMAELEKLHPGLTAKAEALMKDHPSFKYGFHENESVPLNLFIQTKDSKPCSLKLSSLPKTEPFVPVDCKFCEVKDVKNSFVNDCSYMISKDFPESKVDALIGSNDRNRKQYCQHDMTGRETDMKNIDDAAKELCRIAQNGMVPDFNLQTSRNLYKDKTPQLARKRGLFIQKYLRDQLMNQCDLAALPDWISSEEEFAQKVKLSHPFYEGGKEGDYGPDPAAPRSEQEKEIKNLEITLKREKADVEKGISDVNAEIKAVEAEITRVNSEISRVSKEYTALQGKVAKSRDLNAAKPIFDSEDPKSATSLASEMDDWINLSHQQQQKLSDLKSLKRGQESRLKDYAGGKIDERVGLLRQYYSERNTGPKGMDFFNQWDEKLFNDFKMVKISGRALSGESLVASKTSIDPKLDVMLNMVTEMDEFACVVSPLDTKNVKLRAYLKGAAMFGTGTIALAGVLGAGALTLGAGIINTTLSLVCFGCGDPGRTLPKWRQVGNLFALGGKGARRAFWSEFKGVIEDFVTINGRLSLKTGKDIKVNNYNDFDKYARQYYGDQYQEKTNLIEGALTVKEFRDKKNKLIRTEAYDSNGVLRESIEYSPNSGKVIESTRYNKDGKEL